MRVLITGASGFAGGYLARACADAGEEVIGLSRKGSTPAGDGRSVDLRDPQAVRNIVGESRPEVIYHLAALSSVGRSWEDPGTTLSENATTALSLLEAVRHEAPRARVVWVSSCEVYGVPRRLPVEEEDALAPTNPYAISKTAAEMLAGIYADAYRLEIVRARPFSHAGPGQLPIFVVSSLARQAAEGRLARAQSVRILTGNPDTRRDFTDVRDVVRAYRLLAELADPGIYNVSSGRSVSAAEQVEMLAELLAPATVEHVVDPARVRAHEVMELTGSHDRLTDATAWQPQIPFRQTISDAVDWWQRKLAGAGAN